MKKEPRRAQIHKGERQRKRKRALGLHSDRIALPHPAIDTPQARGGENYLLENHGDGLGQDAVSEPEPVRDKEKNPTEAGDIGMARKQVRPQRRREKAQPLQKRQSRDGMDGRGGGREQARRA